MTDSDDKDLLAAEYVLGTLERDERADVASRLTTDPELAGAVQAWQERLAPLADAVQNVPPPAAVYGRIVARLFGPGEAAAQLRRRLRRWQGATAGFAMLAASLLTWVAVRDGSAPSREPSFTAVLQRDASAPAMVVDVDLGTRRLTVHPLTVPSPTGHAYELWLIEPAIGAPRSLGLVPAGGAHASLADFSPAVIQDATFAVTVEPPGGSPSGVPTAAPILAGKLVATPP